jgi:holo-[acyl-carrier protein] synthase
MKCGIDLIEKSRISAIHNSRFREKFINRILTKSEQSRLKDDNHQYNISYLAKRWAAKEAVAKCLGCGIGGQISFLDIEISSNESGEPFAEIKKTDQKISISISDTKENAIAIAIL